MKGSVLQDTKTGHFFIQLYWQKKKERFYRFESGDQWFPFESRGHARKILSIMQGQIDNGDFRPEAWRPGSRLSLDQYSQQWLKTLNVCSNTARFYRTCIKRSINYFGKEKDIRSFYYSGLMIFYKELGLAEKGKYHALNTLKTMLKCAVRDGVLRKMPEFPRLTDATTTDVEYLTFEEQQTVVRVIPEKHRPIFELGMEYGVRIGELRAIKKDCIEDEELVIKRSFSQFELRETTKTKRIRRLPLTSRAREILQRTPASFSEFVFTYDGQRPYYERKLRSLWKAACGEVGIKIHLKNAIRHSLGCQLLDEGQDLEMVRDIYGHTSTNMTRRYVKRTPRRVLEALERRGKVFEFTGHLPTKDGEVSD